MADEEGEPEEGASEAQQQQKAKMAAEVAALAALPGLRHPDVDCSAPVQALLCAALLERIDDGGALASLRFSTAHHSAYVDFRSLGAWVARSRTPTSLALDISARTRFTCWPRE
jgi:hypothetical protein